MNIAFDGRAAVCYSGSGMSSYSRSLLTGFLKTPARITAKVLLPDGYYDATYALQIAASYCSDFWERIDTQRATIPSECTLLHDPNNGFGLPDHCSLPCVVTIHDLIPLVLPSMCGEPYGANFRRRIGHIVRQADRIIAVSEHTKRDLVLRLDVPPTKITVIHEAADKRFTPQHSIATRRFCTRYNLSPGYLLYVGGFSKRKQVNNLIRAFCQARAPFSELVIAGRKGPRSEKLSQLAATLPYGERVHFLGHIDDAELPLLYGGAGLFAYPSLYEGFGLPPLEAVACGCPVLTTTAASIQEIMGSGAFYVSPGDNEALAAALHALAKDETTRRELAARGLARARKFSAERCFQQTLQVYESLCR